MHKCVFYLGHVCIHPKYDHIGRILVLYPNLTSNVDVSLKATCFISHLVQYHSCFTLAACMVG